ncbi:hypothetical protein BsWGS_24091 [Bradybaena similaris]
MRSSVQLLVLLCCVTCLQCAGTNGNETAAKKFLEFYDHKALKEFNAYRLKSWEKGLNEDDLFKHEKFKRDMRIRALEFNESAMSYDTRRQLSKIKNIGTAAQPNDTKVRELMDTLNEMLRIYLLARLDECDVFDCVYLYAKSFAKTPLEYYNGSLRNWVYFRERTGRGMKELYATYVKLSNEAVQFLGYHDLGEQWLSNYESDNFVAEVNTLFNKVLPLYKQLHAFVRRRLQDEYGKGVFPSTGHIPEHLLGELAIVKWDYIYSIVAPFKDKALFDVTPEMVRQNYTALRMFKTAEQFFTSLGFSQLSPKFWNTTRMTQADKFITCGPFALDLYDGNDFRIQMCTKINQLDFSTVHHEMGHIFYFMSYKNQPIIYREGANEAFQEAVGDTIGLSFQTPAHQKQLGLIDEIPTDNETELNFLMNMALHTVAYLPFSYIMDLWRWSVFNGTITPENYNKEWWRLTCELQGVSPPVPRSEDNFDPAALAHLSEGNTYVRYFLANILNFQFYKALCSRANHKGPLHRCDIYGNAKAAKNFRKMLEQGSSKHWREVLEEFTGSRTIDVNPILEYFKPLTEFLEKENGDDIGWQARC